MVEWYIIGIVILVITILISVFDKQIVNFLTPIGKKIRECVMSSRLELRTIKNNLSCSIPFGWLIPIGILFIISFPPVRICRFLPNYQSYSSSVVWS
ncbi:MAG TPA: hypothetical protein VGO47_07655 [Chlamydiales bacterium]|nr:hypothetical protein [Chlamydiales bacterium]